MKYLSLLVMLPALCVSSCTKEATSAAKTTKTTDTSTLDFSYSGVPITGDTLHFTSNAPAGSTFYWKFGDSTTSSLPDPTHIYVSTNSFLVTLVISGTNQDSVSKNITISDDPGHTQALDGTRMWHHYYNTTAAPAYDTLADTSFAITYIDPLTVKLGNDILSYIRGSNNGTSIYFGYFEDVAGVSNKFLSLSLNYQTNKVIYQHSVPVGMSTNGIDLYTSF